MEPEVLIFTHQTDKFKQIENNFVKEQVGCIITDNLDDYIELLKKYHIVISLIDHEFVKNTFTEYQQLYKLLSLKPVLIQMIIKSENEGEFKFLEVDVYYDEHVLDENLWTDMYMYYQSANVLLSTERNSDFQITKNDVSDEILKELALKDRKICALYVQLTEFQSKIKTLYSNWDTLNVPRHLKKVHEFHNQFKLLVLDQKQDWEEFHEHFVLIHPNFFEKIQEKYTNLTDENIRMCAYIKMGMSNKEIAAYLNILPNSVKRAQNRIKHKLNMSVEKSLRKEIQDIG